MDIIFHLELFNLVIVSITSTHHKVPSTMVDNAYFDKGRSYSFQVLHCIKKETN